MAIKQNWIRSKPIPARFVMVNVLRLFSQKGKKENIQLEASNENSSATINIKVE